MRIFLTIFYSPVVLIMTAYLAALGRYEGDVRKGMNDKHTLSMAPCVAHKSRLEFGTKFRERGDAVGSEGEEPPRKGSTAQDLRARAGRRAFQNRRDVHAVVYVGKRPRSVGTCHAVRGAAYG